LDDPAKYSYKDIQRLCKALGVPASGKREILVQRLLLWHRGKSEQDFKEAKEPEFEDDCFINVTSNFSLLEVDVGSPSGRKTVPERLLSPLINKPRRRPDGTPIGNLFFIPNVGSATEEED